MLNTITWPQFFIGSLLLLAIYYLIIGLVFQKREKNNRPQKIHSEEEQKDGNSLVGKPRIGFNQPQVTEVNVPAEEVLAAPLKEQEEDITTAQPVSSQILLLQHTSSLMEEINSVIDLLQSGTREECSVFLSTLLAQYPMLMDTRMQDLITLFIFTSLKAQTTFDYELLEIKDWWSTNSQLPTSNTEHLKPNT